MIRLSDEQRDALHRQPDKPIHLVDDSTGTDYILVRTELFERMQTALAEELDVRGAYSAMDAVARREGWDDSDMDSYNVYARRSQ